MTSAASQSLSVSDWPDSGVATEGSRKGVSRQAILPLCKLIFYLFCAESLFSVAYRSVALATHSNSLKWIAGVGMVAFAALCFRFREPILTNIRRWVGRLPCGSAAWFWTWLVLGLLVRVVWATVYHIKLTGDGIAYFTNAATLATHHGIDGTFWPPGFSLFEAPFLMVLGVHPWVTDLTTLLLFIATYIVTYRLGLRIAGAWMAGVACTVLAIWPTLVALTPANSKECFLLLLITSVMLLQLMAVEARGAQRWSLLAASGILIGCCALTQPGFMLFPFVSLCTIWLAGLRVSRAALGFVVIAAAMFLAISPWTLRNYMTFHRLVLISSNGGSVFWRANNPDANASYMEDEQGVLVGDTFAQDKEGYHAGEEWILHHPLDFAALAVRKQVTFLGEDGIGPYESMKAYIHPTRRFYGLAKAICNLAWLGTWLIGLLAAPRLFARSRWVLWFGFCFLPIFYQLLIDSVFESGSRHHVCFTALVGLLVGVALVQDRASIGTRPSRRANLR